MIAVGGILSFLIVLDRCWSFLIVVEIWEEGADHSYWWNAALRELSPVKPLAFEESLVGMRVWLTRPTSGGEAGQGKLTR